MTNDGEDDPVDDCSDEAGPQSCFPDVDITNVDVSCDQGTTTVRVAVAADPVATPSGFLGRSAFSAEQRLAMMSCSSAVASGGAYSCTLTAGGAAQLPLGANDVCGITADGTAWEFVLSAESAGAGLTDVNIDFNGLGPDSNFRKDVAGPFPMQCD